MGILDLNSNFISLNEEYANVIGYPTTYEALGLSYNAFKGDAAEKSEIFREQDLGVLKTHAPLIFLSYHRYYKGSWRLLYGEKTCIFDDDHHPVGIFSHAKDITEAKLIDVSRFLLRAGLQKNHLGKITQQPFTYYITQDNDRFMLSRKEKEILFYFIRGKTAQEIADIFCRAKRTIDMQIESIKNKFTVSNKSSLIEKAIFEGYMNTIPESLLKVGHE